MPEAVATENIQKNNQVSQRLTNINIRSDLFRCIPPEKIKDVCKPIFEKKDNQAERENTVLALIFKSNKLLTETNKEDAHKLIDFINNDQRQPPDFADPRFEAILSALESVCWNDNRQLLLQKIPFTDKAERIAGLVKEINYFLPDSEKVQIYWQIDTKTYTKLQLNQLVTQFGARFKKEEASTLPTAIPETLSEKLTPTMTERPSEKDLWKKAENLLEKITANPDSQKQFFENIKNDELELPFLQNDSSTLEYVKRIFLEKNILDMSDLIKNSILGRKKDSTIITTDDINCHFGVADINQALHKLVIENDSTGLKEKSSQRLLEIFLSLGIEKWSQQANESDELKGKFGNRTNLIGKNIPYIEQVKDDESTAVAMMHDFIKIENEDNKGWLYIAPLGLKIPVAILNNYDDKNKKQIIKISYGENEITFPGWKIN